MCCALRHFSWIRNIHAIARMHFLRRIVPRVSCTTALPQRAQMTPSVLQMTNSASGLPFFWPFFPHFFCDTGACHKTILSMCETLNNMVNIHPLSSLTESFLKSGQYFKTMKPFSNKQSFCASLQIGFGFHYNSNVVH